MKFATAEDQAAVEKPKVQLRRPQGAGSGLMWAGAAVVVGSVLYGIVTGSSEEQAPQQPAVEVVPSTAAEESAALAAGDAAIAGADAASAAQPQNLQPSSATAVAKDESVQAPLILNGVTIDIAMPKNWQTKKTDTAVYLFKPGSGAKCQMTVDSNFDEEAFKKETLAKEVAFETRFLDEIFSSISPLAKSHTTGTLLQQSSGANTYRYAVALTSVISAQGKSSTIRSINAVSARNKNMARIQCSELPAQGADYDEAKTFALSLDLAD